jgi:hypothetical protein
VKQEGFTSDELVPYSILIAIVLFVIINNYRKGFREFWSPITLICLVFAYYCIIGPYQAVEIGRTRDRLLEMRPFYTAAFWGTVICLSSCIVGFHMNRKVGTSGRLSTINLDPFLSYYGRRLFIVGFVLFAISVGGRVTNFINPLDAQDQELQGGGLANYLNLSVNFLIPAVTLLFVYFLRTRQGLLWFIIPVVLATGIYTTLGFRYRLVLLFGSLGISYYLVVRKRPNLIFLAIAFFGFVAAMGFIEMTRQYGSGLKLGKLDQKKNKNDSYYESGLKEASVFQTSGAVMHVIPEKRPFAGLEPVVQTLLFPIPKAFYPEKNSAEYLFSTLDTIYGKKVSAGAAILMFGEHYLAFGWIGIVIGGFLLGFFYKNLWVWFMANSDNPMIISTYAVTVIYSYVILSRGYLPQVTMLFFFSVYPAYYIIRRIRKTTQVTNVNPVI